MNTVKFSNLGVSILPSKGLQLHQTRSSSRMLLNLKISLRNTLKFAVDTLAMHIFQPATKFAKKRKKEKLKF